MLISTGELVSQSWRIYLKNLKNLLPYVGLNILLVLVSFGVPVGIFFLANRTNSPALIALGVILYIIGICIAVYGGLWIHVAILKAAKNAVDNKLMSISEVLKKSRSLILPTLGTSLLKVVLIYLGFIAFIVPGIIMLVRYAFAEMVVVYDEPKEGAAAIRMSRAMVAGHWWGMLGRWIVVYIIPVIVIMIIAYLFSLAFKGPLVNAQGIQADRVMPVDVSEEVAAPPLGEDYYNLDELNFDELDLEGFNDEDLTNLMSDYPPYRRGMGFGYSSPLTPRYFAFVGAAAVLSVLMTPYFLVAAALLYTSAKQNQIKK